MKERRLHSLAGAASVAVLALIAFAAARALGPGTPAVPAFNSDAAIPVLMANASGFTLYEIYYWGQDRFGAWPFLLARALARVLDAQVTPEALHAGMMVWMLLGAIFLAALDRTLRYLAGGAWLFVLLAFEDVRRVMAELAQVYPWQLPVVLLAWWALRALHGGAVAWRMALFFAAAVLAVWTSTASAVLLAVLAGVEWLRLRALGGSSPRVLAASVLCIGAAIVAEVSARAAFHLYARVHYGHAYSTRLRLDIGNLADNAYAVSSRLLEISLAPLAVMGVLAAIVSGLLLIQRARTRRGSPERTDALSLICGLGLMALSQLPLLIALDHLRENLYAPRYLMPGIIFGALAAILATGAALLRVPRRFRALAGCAAGAVLAGAAFARLPPIERSPEYVAQREVADQLAARAGTVLLGGDRHTYLFAALVPQGAIIPMPHSSSYRRTNWWEPRLRAAPEAIVVHNEYEAAGSPEQPERWIREYGTWLELQAPHVMKGAGRTFSRYRNVTDAAASWNDCEAGRLGRVNATSGTLLVAANEPESIRDLRATPVRSDDTRGPELPLKRVGRLYSLPWPAGAVAVELRVIAASGDPCRFDAVAVMPSS